MTVQVAPSGNAAPAAVMERPSAKTAPDAASARASASLPAGGKTSPPTSTTPTHAPARHAEVEHSRAQLERFARSIRRELEFRVDDASGRTIITVRNKDTGEIVRQIPSEEVIALARAFADGGPTLLESEA